MKVKLKNLSCKINQNTSTGIVNTFETEQELVREIRFMENNLQTICIYEHY